MITLKLKIKNTIDVSQYCENYSYMFRALFVNFELSEDKNYEYELRRRYAMDSWDYQSCKEEVKAKINQNETAKKKKLESIEEIEECLKNDTFTTKKEKRKKFKLIQKLSYLKRTLNKGVTFGLKSTLKRISYLANTSQKNELEITQQKYQKHRVLPIFTSGEALQNSNRKYNFDFANKKVVFKPNEKTKIPVEFYCSNGQYKILLKLQQNIGEQAISVRLNNDYIWIIYDEQKLNNFHFNKNEYFKELKTIPKTLVDERKNCAIKWYREQESRMVKGKNVNRYIGIDQNPQFIGVCILEKTDKVEVLVYKEVVSLEKLSTRLRLSSTDCKQVKQNNKRKYEICHAWKRVFKIAKHHGVANFVMEDLDFKDKKTKDKIAKEANRKTKNIWHRELTTRLITKYCNTLGINLIAVNACYSSFIGNIKYNYFDPLNAAIEVCRRGIYKYFKGSSIFPLLERSDFDTMNAMGLDVQNNTISTWAQAFKLFNTAKLRYRRELKNFVENNLISVKSGIKIYRFI